MFAKPKSSQAEDMNQLATQIAAQIGKDRKANRYLRVRHLRVRYLRKILCRISGGNSSRTLNAAVSLISWTP